MNPIPNKEDFNNDLGKVFENHVGNLLSKTFNKKNNLYFKINFDIIDAIVTIKSKLLQNLPKENKNTNDDKEEFQIFKNIKQLVNICNFYLKKVIELDSKKNPLENQKKAYKENQINSIQENRANISMNLYLGSNTLQNQQIFGTKNKNSKNDSSNIIAGE